MAEYSVLYPTNDIVKYTSATPDLEYVKNDVETLFGPINAPKLYAQELDTLELASSGKVAFTLSNSHAMDLLATGGDVLFRARDALSLALATESSNVTIRLDETNDSLDARAASNVAITAGVDLLIGSGRDAVATACNSFAIDAPTLAINASNVAVDASNVEFASSNVEIAARTLAVDVDEITQTAASNLRVAGGDVLVTAARSLAHTAATVLVGATESAIFSSSNTLAVSGGDVAIESASNVSLASPSNVTVGSGNVFVSASAGARVAGNTLEILAGDSAVYASSNDTLLASAGGTVLVRSARDLTLEATGAGDVRIRTPNDRKTVFGVGGANIVEMYRTEFYDTDSACNLTDYKVRINADLEVLGTTSSVAVNETTLNIEDKVVHLAFNSNLDHPYDGTTNDGAGIMVDGMPESGDPAVYERYEKSIKWFHGANGVPALGGNDITGEAFWNVRGGGLRITQVDDANGDEVAFGFRINALHELEIYKMVTPAGGSPATARVAKLGRSVVA